MSVCELLAPPQVCDAVDDRVDLDRHGRRDLSVRITAPAAVCGPGDGLVVTWAPRSPTLVGAFEVHTAVARVGAVYVTLPHAKVCWSAGAAVQVTYRLIKPDGRTLEAPTGAVVECVSEYPPLLDFADVTEASNGHISLDRLDARGATVTVPYDGVPVDSGDTVVVTWTPRPSGVEPFETRFTVERARGDGSAQIPLDRVRACEGSSAEIHYRVIKRGGIGEATSGRSVFAIDPTPLPHRPWPTTTRRRPLI
ncbi:hypothetical protein [Embleya sp. MST-111070]|uniref:hypothetical protein n=1 Tax=Embleya sp. MST-111070 TaxID=3398231 RepID=UPI003F735B19